MNNIDFLKENLPILLPLFILEFLLMITAVRSVIKNSEFRFGNKAMWLIIVIFIQMIGPVIYFVFGRRNEE